MADAARRRSPHAAYFNTLDLVANLCPYEHRRDREKRGGEGARRSPSKVGAYGWTRIVKDFAAPAFAGPVRELLSA